MTKITKMLLPYFNDSWGGGGGGGGGGEGGGGGGKI